MNAALAAVALALALQPIHAQTVTPGSAERQHAPADGWGAQEGGTRGGALALPAHVFTVRNRAELVAALTASAPSRIVRVAATIDMTEGRPFADSADRRGAAP